MKILSLLICIVIALPLRAEQLPERLLWDKVPLNVTFPVGKERMVTFDHPSTLYFPAEVAATMRFQNVGNRVYVLAKEPFETARAIVKDNEGNIILLDAKAINEGPTTELIIQVVTDDMELSDGINAASGPGAPNTSVSINDLYITMTRFAAQQVYAPTRLLTTPSWMTRVPVTRDVLPIYKGSELTLSATAQWKRIVPPLLYVTAVKARNNMPYGVEIDPRNLKGEFTATTLQHGRVLPQGSDADTTTIYIITERPFEESL